MTLLQGPDEVQVPTLPLGHHRYGVHGPVRSDHGGGCLASLALGQEGPDVRLHVVPEVLPLKHLYHAEGSLVSGPMYPLQKSLAVSPGGVDEIGPLLADL